MDAAIPPHVIHNARGVAILTVLKAGFLFSGRAGGGLVVGRCEDGSWSAPSAIGTAGMGFGGQIGAELTDFVIILNTQSALDAFSRGGNVTLGGNLSVAAGPFGRNAEVAGTMADLAPIYSYSKTKGLFAGISIEGSAIIERKETNAAFYGSKVSARDILSGRVAKPSAAGALYRALERQSLGQDQPPSNLNLNPRQPLQSADRFAPSQSNGTFGRLAQSPNVSSSDRFAQSPNVSSSDRFSQSQAQSNYASSNQPSTNAQTYKSGPPPILPYRGSKPATATASFEFVGQQSTDLSFQKGDLITILKRTESNNDWWVGRCNGREGDVF